MANERLGASFSIDVTNLKAGLAQANRLIRESESQFKAAAAGLDDWTKSEEGVNAKIKSLNEITDVQRKKVAALQQEYERLIDNGLDPTSKEAVTLRTRINQEQAALASNEKELRKQTAALDDVGKSSDEAGKSVSKFGSVAKAAGAVAATAFAAAAAAVGALMKQSLDSFAEYEQLVGGVETLYKDNADQLMGYAEKAYQTAGMSANEYMSNVTSFSAALISSLGGDTEKAAATADRAMRDISDNANKMGTDMSSIVDTYQSLARGNFQMLDNLKLGYGGTKTELERLIADASKMTDVQKELNVSVKEGDTSFANIVNAISVVQSNMGIMGTTAKEASTTIQGSVGAMKAAWANLVTGLADETADIDSLITNFIDSLTTAAENILPRLTIIVQGIVQMAQRLLPQIPALIEEMLPVVVEGIIGLLDGIVAVFPTIVQTILGVIPQLLDALIKMLPTILTTIVDIIVQIINAVTAMIPDIVAAIMEVLPTLIQALVDAIPQLLDASIQFLMAIVDALPFIINALIDQLPELIEMTITTLINNQTAVMQASVQLFMGIIKAIPQIITNLVKKMPEIIKAIVTGLKNGISDMVSVGGELIEGLWEGIKDAGKWLKDKISGFASGIVDGFKDFFGIHSPSKVFEDQIGKNMALGIGVGFEKNMASVNKQIKNAIQIDGIGVSAHISESTKGENGGKSVVVYQTNNYSQAHSRFEIYKSKQQTMAAVQLALAGG